MICICLDFVLLSFSAEWLYWEFGAWGMWQQCNRWSCKSSFFLPRLVSLSLSCFASLKYKHSVLGGCLWLEWVKWAAVLCVNEHQRFPSFSLLCYPSTLSPYSCSFPLWNSTRVPWSVFSSIPSLFYLSLSLSRYHPVWGPSSTNSPLLSFLKSLSFSVFLLSPAVLHSCSTSEGGGQGRKREEEGGGTSFRGGVRRREGKGEGGPLSLWECLLPAVLRRTPAWLKP